MKCAIFSATILSVISFVLLLVGFLSSSPKASALSNVYFFKIKIDFKEAASSVLDAIPSSLTDKIDDPKVSSAINDVKNGNWDKAEDAAKGTDFESAVKDAKDGDYSSITDALGSFTKRADDHNSSDKLTFSIGASGYCVNFKKCYSQHTPFYFDFEKAIKDTVGQKLPDDISKYQKYLKIANQAIWITSLIAILCFAGSVVAGVFAFIFSCCSRVATIARIPTCFTVFFSIIGALSTVVAAVVATALYLIVKNKLNDYTGDFGGIDSSLGAGGMAIYWVTFIVSLVATLVWGAASRASKRQISYMAPAAPAPMAYGGAGSYYH